MDYSIYPFKRYGKNRLYVRFEDQIGNEVDRSTGVTYGLDATKKERQQAKKEAAQKAKQIIEEYHQQLEVPAPSPEPAPPQPQVPHLATYLEQDYWPYVGSNCAAPPCRATRIPWPTLSACVEITGWTTTRCCTWSDSNSSACRKGSKKSVSMSSCAR